MRHIIILRRTIPSQFCQFMKKCTAQVDFGNYFFMNLIDLYFLFFRRKKMSRLSVLKFTVAIEAQKVVCLTNFDKLYLSN